MNSSCRAVTPIVLAAGEGKRYQELKQLASIDGKPVLEHVLNPIRKIEWAFTPLVVLGYEKDRIEDSLDFRGFRVIENESWRDGMSTSLKRGVRAAEPESSGYLLFLGDMPLIGTSLIEAVLGRARMSASMVAPIYQGQRGFPVYLAKKWKQAILDDVFGDRGAREILANNEEELSLISTEDRGVVLDLDSRDDLDRIRTYLTEGRKNGF